jgi:hypothetical protein
MTYERSRFLYSEFKIFNVTDTTQFNVCHIIRPILLYGFYTEVKDRNQDMLMTLTH